MKRGEAPRALLGGAVALCAGVFATHALAAPALLEASPGYGRIAAVFEPNVGQAPADTLFIARGHNATLHLKADGAVIRLARPRELPKTETLAEQIEARVHPPRIEVERASIQLKLAGAARAARMEPVEPLASKSHYLKGNDPAKWITDVPHYAKVAYRDVYPGVDQVFYGDYAKLEYDLVVKPGADPRAIAWAFDALTGFGVDDDGNLLLDTKAGRIVHRKPVAYQIKGDARVPVDASYVPTASGATLRLGAYDPSLPLVIDPVIQYGTYLGGSGDDTGTGIGVDGSGNAYVTGRTTSLDFPTLNANKPSLDPADGNDAFVTKINAAGNAIVWSTYLGGSDIDQAQAIAVTPDGTPIVVGTTNSADFPVVNAAQSTLQPFGNSFVSKLNPDGKGFVYSTYLGGTGLGGTRAVAAMATGEVFVTGQTGSSFPGASTISNCQTPGMVFVTQYGPLGDKRYSVCVGGTHMAGGAIDGDITVGSNSVGLGIAVDAGGHAYVSGMTLTVDFPTMNAVQPQLLPGKQMIPVYATFAFKLNVGGTALVYSTYVGGDYNSYGGSIAVDTAGNAYVTGSEFLVPCSIYKPPCDDGQFLIENPIGAAAQKVGATAFVVKIAPRGDKFIYSTYIGVCSGGELWGKVAVDPLGNAYVTGYSSCEPSLTEIKAVVLKLNQRGDAIGYHTNVGGAPDRRSIGYGIAADDAGNAYVTGQTYIGGISTVNPIQPNPGGGPSYFTDAFVTKIIPDPLPTTFTLESSLNPAPFSEAVTFTVTVPGVGGQVTLMDGNIAIGQVALPPTGSRTTFTLATLPPGLHSLTAVWTPSANAGQTSPVLVQRIGELICP